MQRVSELACVHSEKVLKAETTRIKMSLVPFTFNNVALEVVIIDGKKWWRAKEVCKALGVSETNSKGYKRSL